MVLNIRKVVAQHANYNQKINEKDNFYINLIEIVFFICPTTLCPRIVNFKNVFYLTKM